jgi:hypothetical protein
MPAKMFPHLKLLCLLFMGPTLGFGAKQRNSFLIKFGVFYNKSKILTTLFNNIIQYEKITLVDEFLMFLGPIISRFFACSNEEKKSTKTTKGARSSPISMSQTFYKLSSVLYLFLNVLGDLYSRKEQYLVLSLCLRRFHLVV